MTTHKLHVLLALALGLAMVVGTVALLGAQSQEPADAQARTAGVLTVCKTGPPDCDYSVVQDAVDAAVDDDLIKVAAGTYGLDGKVQVVLINKSITLRGGYTAPGFADPPDPAANITRLDASQGGRVVGVTDGPTHIEGFEITGGTAGGGGGVAIVTCFEEYVVTLMNNTIVDNHAEDSGGGVLAGQCDVELINNAILSNTAGDQGAGIYAGFNNITLAANTISYNRVEELPGNGGGVYLYEGYEVVFHDNLIAYNEVDGGWGGGVVLDYCDDVSFEDNTLIHNDGGEGGGMYVRFSHSRNQLIVRSLFSHNRGSWGGGLMIGQGNVTVSDSQLIHNTASKGGGLYSEATVDLIGSEVLSNTATSDGGGIYVYGWPLNINRGIVAHNQALGRGGGIFLDETSPVMINNTFIVDNQAYGGGSGIFSWVSNSQLRHATFARNTGGDGSALRLEGSIPFDPPKVAELTNTILVGHAVGVTVFDNNEAHLEATLWGTDTWANQIDWGGPGTILTGAINIWDDPGFVDPAEEDYHIGADSKAIDEGVDAGVYTDFDSEPRPIGLAPDIGADEWRPLTGVKRAAPDTADPNEVVTYSLILTNAADSAIAVRITDTLPNEVGYLGPLIYDNGQGGHAAGVITWTGTVYTTTPTLISWAVQLEPDVPRSSTITNTALISSPYELFVSEPAYILVRPHRVYLPLTLRDS